MLFRILIGVLFFQGVVGGVFQIQAQVKVPVNAAQTKVRSPAMTHARPTTQTQESKSNKSVYTHKVADPDGVGKVYMGREIAKVIESGPQQRFEDVLGTLPQADRDYWRAEIEGEGVLGDE